MRETLPALKFGILDFLDMIYRGHPEYSLLAVKGEIEEVAQAFIEFCQERKTVERFDVETLENKEYAIAGQKIRWEKNIPLQKARECDCLAQVFPLIQVRGSEWTVVQRSLFYLGWDECHGVPQEARSLSAKLQTKAITLMEEDTSGAMGYELFENGKSLEEFEEAGEVRFTSQLREQPNINFDWEPEDEDCEWNLEEQPRVKFINELFCELGIYLPACYLATNSGKYVLAVEAESENTIERADWLRVNTRV